MPKIKSLVPCDCNYCSSIRYPFIKKKGFGKNQLNCAIPQEINRMITTAIFRRNKFEILEFDVKNQIFKYKYK